jgi:hypothetical protein
MAKQEFLRNFRVARNLFGHQRVQADSPLIDAKVAESMINRADIWLTPKSVQGFDVADFPELGPDGQSALQTAVREFLEIATRVPPKEPAAFEQVRIARVPFTSILEILAPYLPTPQEKQQVEAALQRIAFPNAFPNWVASWDAELGSDEEGGPAVWIDVYVDEHTVPRDEVGRFASQLTAQIQQALAAEGSNRWPYVRMRTVAEHKTA